MDNTFFFILGLIMIVCIAFVFIRKYFMMKSELNNFKNQIHQIRTTDREQPITVASFGTSSVELANEINALIQDLTTLAREAAENEKKMRIVMAGVSHDFRTPLTAADGYLQMIEKTLEGCRIVAEKSGGYDDNNASVSKEDADIVRKGVLEQEKELREYLGIVHEKVSYLKNLSDEFFEVTYIDASEKVELSPVRFDTVLSDVLLAAYSVIEEKKLEMKMDIPEEKLLISADEHYLKRILENLFSNAEKYAVSFIEVTVKREDGAVRLSVKNDISGDFSPDTDHIFEPFYRAKGRSGPGSGLGLYVCKELADFMNFKIEGSIESDIFCIELIMPEA